MKNFFSIQKLSLVLAYLVLFAAVLIPVAKVAFWVFWRPFGHELYSEFLFEYNILDISPSIQAAGAAVFLIGALIEAYGLLGLHRTFVEASQGRSLSAKAVSGFRRFAWVMLVMVPVAFMEESVVVSMLTLVDSSQEPLFHIGFGADSLAELFWALMFVVVAEIFAEAHRAKDENEAFL